jgi:hypothetical protein
MSLTLIVALALAAFVFGVLSILGLLVVVRVAQLVLKQSIARRAMLDSAKAAHAPAPSYGPEPVAKVEASPEVYRFVTSAPAEPDASIEKSILDATERELSKLKPAP